MPLHAVIMAGGTGGHIYPALAVARELIDLGFSVSWLGTRRGLESKLIPDAGLDIDYIDIEGVRGKSAKTLIKAPFLILKAIRQASSLIKQRQANVVLGFGGFVAGPGGFAAKMLGIPLIIHEQNAVAGTTNKILAKIATQVYTAFPNVFKQATVVGNPVRKEISSICSPKDRWPDTNLSSDSPFHLLVLGGSLGAAALNESVPKAVEKIISGTSAEIHVRHQCGGKNLDSTIASYEACGLDLNNDQFNVMPFVEDMAEAYSWAHFVICRAGALTVAEIAAAGCASLMIPFPHAIDDHQTQNALWLVSSGAGKICQQKELTLDRLIDEIQSAMRDRPNLLTIAEKARSLAVKDTAEIMAKASLEVIR
ncbi:undecaprenyldiphospho-muramoylpentapeptide beta-N-acetylglucosaminyltransferase [Sessilibacter corallicola]|uniref:UDP-N-acetylglucosamine--N-acetylmuramyl-(pentapeptide) pyrophosphoryl-undecaprenol N-acetylglucosamine transferase n=1 Tax=Sessilibacter corallicola TaxID=2904075 RepID=A0ABQ0A3Q0_9GAMM|nr:undecaprenyldiphospho-muramoylpentapeptide beta-N-acetylglucosaminyltransferase [Sessilibacter corallicola]MCE2027104.1 undecaprenyldiphospho-muramoylpentapeptide beta-N-acetylglucosaminyltransferase [Sessilibacter corallicola]